MNPHITYRDGVLHNSREEMQFQVFEGRVVSVDYENKCLNIRNVNTDVVYPQVYHFPANASGYESSDVQMPEEGTACSEGSRRAISSFARTRFRRCTADWN